MLREKKAGKDHEKYMLCEKTLNNLSMDSGTMESKQELSPLQKPVPWFINKQVNPDKQAFIKQYQDKEKHQVINDMFLPAMYRIGEIIHSADTPAQTALQGCQLIANKVIGDKIDITQQKQVVDVNKLLDQLVTLKSLDTKSPVIEINHHDNDDR